MIGATIKKDVWLLLVDRGRLAMLFAMPIVFIVVFGSVFKFGPDSGAKQAIAIWHAPGNPLGDRVAAALAASDAFDARPMASADEVRRAVAHDAVRAGLVIPVDHDPDHAVELSIDLGSPIQVRGPLEGALTGVVMQAVAPVGPRPSLVVAKSPPGLAAPIPNMSGFQVTVPGNAVLFGFFMAMVLAMSFAHERSTGAWKRLLAAPVPRWKLVLGKLVPYYLIALVQLGVIFGIGAGLFGMEVAGSIVALVAVTALVALCAIALGLLVASFGWTERQIGSGVPPIVLVMGLLGGCMFPRIGMPPFMQQLGHVVPHSWALDAYYDVLVRQGTTVFDVAPSLAALAAFAVGFGAIGLWRFRFE